jgi:syntaxin-binding protein 5
MWNIAEKRSERTWEFMIPPGASGGGNDLEDSLFTERRPGVTCLAWRADGLLFAVVSHLLRGQLSQ